MCYYNISIFAPVAQRIEYFPAKEGVAGSIPVWRIFLRKGGRVAEGARLESVYTARYRGFKSHPFRVFERGVGSPDDIKI